MGVFYFFLGFFVKMISQHFFIISCCCNFTKFPYTFFHLFTVDTEEAEGYEFSQNVPKFYTGGTERFWGPNLNPGTLYILFF